MAMKRVGQSVAHAVPYVGLPIIVSEVVKGQSKKMITAFIKTNQFFVLVDSATVPLSCHRVGFVTRSSAVPQQGALPISWYIRVVEFGFGYWRGILNVSPIHQIEGERRCETEIAL